MVKKKKARELIPVSVEQPEYDVEAIRKARVTLDKKWEYFIKWSGYPESDNSWEPEAHLDGCVKLLKDFWALAPPGNKSQASSLPFAFEVIPPRDDRMEEGDHKLQEKNQRHTKSTGASGIADAENDVTQLVTNIPPERNATTTTTIVQMLSPVADDIMSDDDIPLNVIGEAEYTDPDDIPLSQFEALRTHRTPKGKKPEEDVEKVNAVRRLPSEPPGDNRSGHISPSHGDQGLFSSRGNETPLPSIQGTKPVDSTSTPHPVPKIPAHIVRRTQPKVKPIDITEGFQGIPAKSRIARRGTGPTISPVSKANLPVSPSDSMPVDADQWLRDNFQPLSDPRHNSAPVHTSTPALPSFSKRWKWSGSIYIGDNESDDGFADLIGSVKMADNVPGETRPDDLTMGLLFPENLGSLLFRHNYTLPTLSCALGGFRLTHYARMTADLSTTDNDATDTRIEEENLFASLIAYMEKNHLYSCTPLTLQDKEVATMFIVPTSMQHVWDSIKLPERLRQGDTTPSFVVIIGVPVYEPSKGELLQAAREDRFQKLQMSSSYLSSFPDFGRAAMKLEFPEPLFKRLNHRKYAIFTGGLSSATAQACGRFDPETDVYTKALILVMETIPGTEKLGLHDGEARSIFIHVGAWKTLHKLLGLVDRRLRRLDVEFFTYGADPTVERRFWGVQGIFPIGGIVTFTSRSVFEDPDGALNLIRRLNDHSLWGCYVHPVVISMLAKLLRGVSKAEIDVHEISIAHKSLSNLLRVIEKGQLEVMWQPPAPYKWRALPPYIDASSSSTSPESFQLRESWCHEQENLSKLRGVDFITECERSFPADNYNDKDIENLLVNDMVVMQSEYRKDYRRFIIITDTGTMSNASKDAANVSASSYEVKDMFEFTHIKKFKFDEENLKENSKANTARES